MKLITLDMALKIVLLVGKVIDRVKNGVYDISLFSHVNVNEFNNMILFGVRRFEVNKETYISTICNTSHSCPESIR